MHSIQDCHHIHNSSSININGASCACCPTCPACRIPTSRAAFAATPHPGRRNASGKSCFLNILLQMALADGDEAYRARGAGEQPGLSLLSSRYGDWDAIQAAIREGDLAVQFNTRPSPDAEGAKHMQIVEGSLADYYSGQRSKFGRQKTSLLLPVGKNTDTTRRRGTNSGGPWAHGVLTGRQL